MGRLRQKFFLSILAAGILSTGFLPVSTFSASPGPIRPRALVVDYEMNPPVVLAGLLENLARGGIQPRYRPFYPQITRKDLREVSLLVILSGDGPGYPGTGMSVDALEPLRDYVRAGGTLVLGPLPGGTRGAGNHERYLFNLLLHRLKVPIQIEDNWVLDEENHFATPLYRAPFALLSRDHPWTRDLGEKMVTDRSPSLRVGSGAEVLAHSFPSAFPQGNRSQTGIMPLVAMGRAGDGAVVVAGRYLLTWGGGNGKEPGVPLLPLPREENALREFQRNLFAFLARRSRKPADETSLSTTVEPPPPPFPLRKEALPDAPPKGIEEVQGWVPAPSPAPTPLDPQYTWVLREGIRAGWAHIDKEPDELARMAAGIRGSGMNALWGVGFPQAILKGRTKPEVRARILSAWEKLGKELKGSPVRWFMGMEYPGRYPCKEPFPQAVGAEGRPWDIPSPWPHDIWRREVVRPAMLAAQWAHGNRAMAGIVLDLEMYGRHPLFFSQGVDFGDGPFQDFLENLPEEPSGEGKGMGPEARFPWLRERGLLKEYYGFLEKRAETLGRELRLAVREVHPDLIIGCYTAGILHRWFYRGLWRGMSEPERPLLLFTFQRDVEMDLAELRAHGVQAIHVRALLMGMMQKGDYPALFADALTRHGGYWLNRLTSLVAPSGFLPVEAPADMAPQEAWSVITKANAKTPRAAMREEGR